jgi:hypothetical protein
VGTQFDILNASSISGSFSAIDVTNSSDTFKALQVGNQIELTVETVAPAAASGSPAQSVHAGLVHGHYGREVYGGQRQLATAMAHTVAPAIAPQMPLAPVGRLPMGAQGFRPRDEFGSPAAVSAPVSTGDASGAGSLGIAPVSAAAYNSMSGMNHQRFECGVDLKALLKTSRKQLLKGLWAAPDSKDALALGYMTYTGSH